MNLGHQEIITSSGVKVRGNIVSFLGDEHQPIYYKTQGPTELRYNNSVLPGQGVEQHSHGFSAPLGHLKKTNKLLENMNLDELNRIGIIEGQMTNIEFASGVIVHGELEEIVQKDGRNILLIFKDQTAEAIAPDGSLLFEKSWGTYDMAIGARIDKSVKTDLLLKTSDFFIQNIIPKLEASIKGVPLTQERAFKKVQQSLLSINSYSIIDQKVVINNGWHQKLRLDQKEAVRIYNEVITGASHQLKINPIREAVLVKEIMNNYLPKKALLEFSQSGILFDLSKVNFDLLNEKSLRHIFEFQEVMNRINQDPQNYKQYLDKFTNRFELSNDSLSRRGLKLPSAYEEFTSQLNYRNWEKKIISNSNFSLDKGERVIYRSRDGDSILENYDSSGQLRSVEIIFLKDLSDRKKGVAFFSYGVKEDSNSLGLSNKFDVHFKGSVNHSKVNSVNGCISCHKATHKLGEYVYSTIVPLEVRDLAYGNLGEQVDQADLDSFIDALNSNYR